MDSIEPETTNLFELSWLCEVTESRQPLTELSPIWVRHGTIESGPPVPHPERHPYCEFGTTLKGKVVSFVEREQALRLPGDLFLAGPGVPHWATILEYPLSFVTVYFLPSVLIEMGPRSDGPRALRRFTAPQPLRERLVRAPPALRGELLRLFQEIVAEFQQERFGSEIRLRTLLMEQLVALFRWEATVERSPMDPGMEFNWIPIGKALQYLRENFAEPVYAQSLARSAGVSESRLKVLFREALGMSWVKYLQGYRIHRAAAALCEADSGVTEAALASGFESLSHFNATFRSFMGVSPTEYQSISRERQATGKSK